jgi:hypothetical protein
VPLEQTGACNCQQCTRMFIWFKLGTSGHESCMPSKKYQVQARCNFECEGS